MRLGFSVAVHTDPKILLVDEVLAVGDENFQHKCLDRIMDLRREGITICFVSHGLGQVRRLCSRAIWLDYGTIQAEGEVDDAVSAYLRQAAAEEESMMGKPGTPKRRATSRQRASAAGSGDAPEDKCFEITDISFLDGTGDERQVFQVGEAWTVRLHYRSSGLTRNPVFRLDVDRNDGLHVGGFDTRSAGLSIPSVEGEGDLFYRVDQLPLMEGTYHVSALIDSDPASNGYNQRDHYAFKVRQAGRGERYGVVTLRGRWDWKDSPTAASTELLSGDVTGLDGTQEGRSSHERRWGTGDIRVVDVSFVDAVGATRRVFEEGEPWTIRLRYRADDTIENPVFGLAVHRSDGVHICGPNSYFGGLDIPIAGDQGEVIYAVDRLPLMEGTYYLSVSAHNRADTVMYDYHDRLYAFRVCQFDRSENDGIASLGGKWAWEYGSSL